MNHPNANDMQNHLLVNRASDCPQCGNSGHSHIFRGLCHHREADSFPTYETWVECSSCGRKGKPVRKPYLTWYLSNLIGDDSIFNAAIDCWNGDC